MLPRHITAEYQHRSLGNLEVAGSLALDSAARFARLGSHVVRAQLDLAHTWALALIDGGRTPAPVPVSAADSPHGLLRQLAANQAELLRVIEAQRRLCGHALHAALADLHQWTPRVADVGVTAIGLAVDAVELPSEVVADAVVKVVAPPADPQATRGPVAA